jgi:DNA-binding NtrC family response regulator
MESLQSTGASPAQRVRVKVLIADDEPTISGTLQMILAQEGFDVVAVSDGKAAIEKAREWWPDLFLSDVVMPEINGIEAAIEITRVLPECRVLLLSGQAVVRDLVREARQRGYDFRILTKPIHPAELIASLRSLLEE